MVAEEEGGSIMEVSRMANAAVMEK